MSLTELTADEVASIRQKSTWPRFLIWPLNSLAVTGLALNWSNDHMSAQVVMTALAAYTFLCFTSCFHETSHQTVCASRWFSVWLGRAIGTMILVPYTTYRESHIRHHAYLNKPSDWELWPYSDPGTSLWFRRVFCWLEFPFGFLTTPIAYGRLYFHKQSPLSDPRIRRTIGLEYLAMAATWTTLLGVVAWGGWWMPFLRAWVIPHWIASVLQTFRKFTEHLGMKSYDPLLGARTVMGPSLWTRIACYFNFDIFLHGPHHRHPRASTHELCGRMADYQRSNPDVEYPVFSTYRAAIRDMLPALINPGVGMNVGAPSPDDEKQHVTNFVADVADEILSERDCVTRPKASC